MGNFMILHFAPKPGYDFKELYKWLEKYPEIERVNDRSLKRFEFRCPSRELWDVLDKFLNGGN